MWVAKRQNAFHQYERNPVSNWKRGFEFYRVRSIQLRSEIYLKKSCDFRKFVSKKVAFFGNLSQKKLRFSEICLKKSCVFWKFVFEKF
jgi:hypothetical protein